MSPFFMSLIFGLLCHRIVSAIQPVTHARVYKFGGAIKLKLTEEAYLAVKVTIYVTSILLFVFFATLVATKDVHPTQGYAYWSADVLTSPRMGSAVFGFLVGVLLSNLLTRVWKTQNYQFNLNDRLEFALIFLLFLLGIGGEEFLRSTAQRINKVSLGTTTEISFSGVTARSSRSSAEQPGGAFRNTDGAIGGSTGLQKLYDIGSKDRPNIGRDLEFIRILARYQKERDTTTVQTWPLAEQVLSPIGSCLSGISQLYGDDTFIDEQLLPLSQVMHDLAMHSTQTPSKIRDKMGGLLKDIKQYVDTRLVDSKTEERYSCAGIARASASVWDISLSDTSIESFRASAEKLPYATMAYASVMTALRRYEAAASAMDSWINSTEARLAAAEESSGKSRITADRWYLLRARLAQIQFVDEWIRNRGAATSSWLRQYHIDNLKAVVDGIYSFDGIALLASKNSNYTWDVGLLGTSYSGDDGVCNFPAIPRMDERTPGGEPTADEQDRLQTIYDTYLSAQKDYVDHALKHPIVKVRSAAIIWNQSNALMKRSLKCIKTEQQITRAEHIERYVRSEINIMDNMSSLSSTDQTRERIRNAEHMLALASQLLNTDVIAATEGRRSGPVQKRIATNRALEAYESLLATRDQLKGFSERETTP
jgi:hypothetical protein